MSILNKNSRGAQVIVCMSSQAGYQRLSTTMGVDLGEGVIGSHQYRIEQNADELIIFADLFAHDEGESYRYSSLRYNTVKKVFELLFNDAGAIGIPMSNGEEYPMGLPIMPMINRH